MKQKIETNDNVLIYGKGQINLFSILKKESFRVIVDKNEEYSHY